MKLQSLYHFISCVCVLVVDGKQEGLDSLCICTCVCVNNCPASLLRLFGNFIVSRTDLSVGLSMFF